MENNNNSNKSVLPMTKRRVINILDKLTDEQYNLYINNKNNIDFIDDIHGSSIFTGKKNLNGSINKKMSYSAKEKLYLDTLNFYKILNKFKQISYINKNNINDFYYVFRVINIGKHDYKIGNIIIEILPFSTTYNINKFKNNWKKNSGYNNNLFCCIFVIKVPITYPALFKSYHQNSNRNMQKTSKFFTEDYEVVLPPSFLKINDIKIFNNETYIFIDPIKQIAQRDVDYYLDDIRGNEPTELPKYNNK